MSLICPACGSAELAITLSLELPPDAYDDEITLQVVECAGCGFHGLAVLFQGG
jgi:C4-type Zn-finger protein